MDTHDDAQDDQHTVQVNHDDAAEMQTIVQVNLFRMPHDTPEFLLLRRISEDNDPSEALWQPISARVEGDGAIEDTLLRAVREQVGLEGFKRLTSQMYTYEWYAKDEQGRDIVFSAEVEPDVDIRLDTDKYGDYAWLPFSEAEQRLKWDGNKEALRRLQAAIVEEHLRHPAPPAAPSPAADPPAGSALPMEAELDTIPSAALPAQHPVVLPPDPATPDGLMNPAMPAMPPQYPAYGQPAPQAPIVQPAYPGSGFGYGAPSYSPPAPAWNGGYVPPQAPPRPQPTVIGLPVYTGPGATPPPPPPPPPEFEDPNIPQQPPQPPRPAPPMPPGPPGPYPNPMPQTMPGQPYGPPMPYPYGPPPQAPYGAPPPGPPRPPEPHDLPPSREPEPYQN